MRHRLVEATVARARSAVARGGMWRDRTRARVADQIGHTIVRHPALAPATADARGATARRPPTVVRSSHRAGPGDHGNRADLQDQSVSRAWRSPGFGDGSTKGPRRARRHELRGRTARPRHLHYREQSVATGHASRATPSARRFKDWPASYGVWGASFDGNTCSTRTLFTRIAAERCRTGNGPALLIAETFGWRPRPPTTSARPA